MSDALGRWETGFHRVCTIRCDVCLDRVRCWLIRVRVKITNNYVSCSFIGKSRWKRRPVYICYLPAGRSVLEKTVPEVLRTARGRRPRVVLKTECTVFPNTDRPWPANNVFIFLSLENYFIRNICVDFYWSSFTPCACVWRFGQANRVVYRSI